MRMRARGLTLVEIMFAMVTLIAGLSAITMMLLSGARSTRASLERNAATMMVSEAVAEIERRHLITSSMSRSAAPSPPGPFPPLTLGPTDPHLGLFIETVRNDEPLGTSTCPDIHDPEYAAVNISENMTHGEALNLKCFASAPPTSVQLAPDKIHMSMWPMPPGELPKTYGSLLVLRSGDTSPHGTPLRVLYRLERHQDWQSHTIDTNGIATYGAEIPNSTYRGVYVLTLTIYKDSKRDGSSLEQVTDPYVVYLYDKKVR